ncbi:MAG TPA: hypothetical protein VFL55_14580 [Acetobacteraceae bacterium]|nr:hypothetical protein [Acetobacteraceae bacterium]
MDLLPEVVLGDITALAHLGRTLQRDGLGTQAMQSDHRQSGCLRVAPDFLVTHGLILPLAFFAARYVRGPAPAPIAGASGG